MTAIAKPGTPINDGTMQAMRVSLPAEYFNTLNFICDQTGESQRSIIRRAVAAFLREAGFPHLQDTPITYTSRSRQKGS